MIESRKGCRARHQPSPEGIMVARTARSPGFGTPLAFPVSQWRSEWRAWPRGPGTRYSGGAAPDLHRLPSIPVRVVFSCSAGASLLIWRSSRKGRLELGLESASLRLVRTPILR